MAGALARHGISHTVLDANLEGMLYLLGKPFPSGVVSDAWSKRAFRYKERNLNSMRDPFLYDNVDRYSRAVKDLGRVLDKVSPPDISVGLADYEDRQLSPLKSRDLLQAAEEHEMDIYYPYFRSRLHDILRKKEPSVVGISLNYLSQALCAFSMIGFIRRKFPAIRIVLGGGLITSWMKNETWQNPFGGLVDTLVAGPGESQLLSLLGVEVRENEIARPEYSLFPTERYLSPGFILPYSASTGCYWNKCSFCPEKAEGNPYRPLPAIRVMRELLEISRETNPVLIHLLDNAISPALFDALICDDIPFRWYGFARVNQRLTDLEFCMALKKAGCVMLKLGIESGDQNVLDALQKGINVQEASTVLKNLKRAGISAYVYLIFGTPPETEASATKTLEFTVAHSHFIDFLNLAIFNMPICGKRDDTVDAREFYEGDLSLYTDFIHPKGWDRKRVRLFLEGDFKHHPAVSGILKHEPPVFTSNHAPFFVMPPGRGQLSARHDRIRNG